MPDDGMLLKNTVFNVLAKGIASGTSLLISMYASRRIGVEDFGTAQYVVWIVSTVWMFLNFGLPITLVRYIALRMGDGKRETAEAMISWSLFISMFICALSVVIFVFALRAPYVLWTEALLLFGFLSFNSVLQSVCEGLMRYKTLFYASLVSGFLMLLCFFPFIHSYSLQGYIAVLVAGAIANFVVLLFGLRDFSLLPRGIMAADILGKDVRSFAFYSWLAAIISSFMWQRMELFFIKTYLTRADVAFFSVAVLLATYVTQPIALLSSALLPYFSRESAGPDNRNARAIYYSLTKVLAWLTFFVCFFAAVHSSFIVRLIYGSAYEPAQNVTAIILAGSSFGTIAAVGSALLYGQGKSRFIVISGGSGAGLAIVAGVMIVPAFGIIGAGIARVAIQFLMICIGTYYIVARLDFSFPFLNYFKCFFLALIICSTLRIIIPLPNVTGFCVNAFLAVLLYVGGTYMLSIFDKEEMIALKEIALRSLIRWKR